MLWNRLLWLGIFSRAAGALARPLSPRDPPGGAEAPASRPCPLRIASLPSPDTRRGGAFWTRSAPDRRRHPALACP